MSAKKETYYQKIIRKHLDEFKQKHKEVVDLEALKELEKILVLALVDCVNDLDTRVRKLERENL